MTPNLAYRKKARVVAFVDLIVTSSTLVIVFALFAGGLFLTVESEVVKNQIVKENPQISSEDASNEVNFIAISVWVVLILVSIEVFLQITAAIKLLNATQIGKGPLAASKLARFWRTVTIVFTVFAFLMVIKDFKGFATNYTDGFECLVFSLALFNFLVRLLAIYIVNQFITELEQAAAIPTLPMYEGQVPMSDAMAYSYAPSHHNSAQPNVYVDPLQMQIGKEKA